MSTLSLLGKKRRSNLVLTLVKKDETKHIEENKTETKEVTTLNDLVAEKEENAATNMGVIFQTPQLLSSSDSFRKLEILKNLKESQESEDRLDPTVESEELMLEELLIKYFSICKADDSPEKLKKFEEILVRSTEFVRIDVRRINKLRRKIIEKMIELIKKEPETGDSEGK